MVAKGHWRQRKRLVGRQVDVACHVRSNQEQGCRVVKRKRGDYETVLPVKHLQCLNPLYFSALHHQRTATVIRQTVNGKTTTFVNHHVDSEILRKDTQNIPNPKALPLLRRWIFCSVIQKL